MTVIMMTEPQLWMLWIGILTAAVVAFNTPVLLSMLRMLPEMLKGRFGR